MTLDKLIVMDNVSGLANKSDVFSNFLQCLENMDYLVYTFFILFTQTDKTEAR